MNKKLLSIALLSASVMTFSACSSDDDDDGLLGGVTDTVTDGVDTVTDGVTDGVDTVTDGVDEVVEGGTDVVEGGTDVVEEVVEGGTEVVEGGTTTPAPTVGAGDPSTLPLDLGGNTPGGYNPTSIQALVEASGGAQGLMALAANGAGFDLALTDNAWTIFLPSDTALAAFGGTVDVQNHIVVTGAFDSTDALGLVGNDPSGLAGNSSLPYVFAGGDGDNPLTINGIEIVVPNLTVDGANGIVHIIDGVLE